MDARKNGSPLGGSLPQAPSTGGLVYWTGSAWAALSPSDDGQRLRLSSGLPNWMEESRAGAVASRPSAAQGREGITWTDPATGLTAILLHTDDSPSTYAWLQMVVIAEGAARGAVVRMGAAGWETVALGAAGKILRSDGTDLTYSTLTLPDTAARGTLLVATGTDTVTALDAKTADTFVGGDGTDVTTRTATQVRASLSLPVVQTVPSTALVVDLDADTLAVGAVSSWASSVGGYAAAQATGSKQPTCFAAGIGGRQSVRFDGTDDLLVIPYDAALDLATLTVYVVARAVRDSSDAILANGWLIVRPFALAGGAPYAEWGMYAGTTTTNIRTDGTEGVGSAFPNSSQWDEPAIHTLSCGAAGGRYHRSGRRLATTATTSITYDNNLGIGIGGRNTTTEGEWTRVDIARVLIYSAQHTPAERQAVEAYLAQQYGLPIVAGLTT